MWYSGSIPEAIAESRSKAQLFVVYISCDDDESRKMDGYWVDDKVNSVMQTTCVSLKLEAESEGYKQFSAIYPVTSVPSAYFIDNKGQALAVLTSQSSYDDFLGKIELVTQGIGESPAQSEISASASNDQQTQRSKEEIEGETQRLQEKIQKKREEDAMKKKENENLQEIERRELGKNLQKIKDAQKTAKLKQDLEERRRDKQEENAAKERVKRQIEQDKIERGARFHKEKLERDQAAAKKQSEIDERKEEQQKKVQQDRDSKARLQFRMPDGSTSFQQFDSGDVLLSAYTFIATHNSHFSSIDSFHLAVPFPRRVFSSSDRDKTFTELGLSPSASLAVLPNRNKGGGGAAVSSDAVSSIWSIVMYILLIPVQILQYLWSFIAGQSSDRSATTTSTDSSQHSTKTNDENTNPGLRRRPLVGSMESKRQGNMTRLSDVKRDDDEDDATWNGNSTQQM